MPHVVHIFTFSPPRLNLALGFIMREAIPSVASGSGHYLKDELVSKPALTERDSSID